MDDATDVVWVFPAIGHSTNKKARNYGHPAHRGFAEAIGANTVVFPEVYVGPLAGTFAEPAFAAWNFSVPDSDIYILENSASIYAAPFIRRAAPDAKIIQLAADLELFGLQSYNFEDDVFQKRIIRRADRQMNMAIINRLLQRYVDGVIAVSELMRDTIRNIIPETPIEIVHPYVQPEIADRLRVVSLPEFDSYQVLTVCEGREHKGVDMLVEAWPAVRKEISDASLIIVGEGHPESYADVSGVSVPGYVEDIISAYEKTSLYVQPARADAFPVTVMEAMWAGRVPLVTQMTGSRSLVTDISDELIVEPQPSALAKGIISHLKTSTDYQRKQAVKAKHLIKNITEERQQNAFVEAIERVL